MNSTLETSASSVHSKSSNTSDTNLLIGAGVAIAGNLFISLSFQAGSKTIHEYLRILFVHTKTPFYLYIHCLRRITFVQIHRISNGFSYWVVLLNAERCNKIHMFTAVHSFLRYKNLRIALMWMGAPTSPFHRGGWASSWWRSAYAHDRTPKCTMPAAIQPAMGATARMEPARLLAESLFISNASPLAREEMLVVDIYLLHLNPRPICPYAAIRFWG